MAASTVITPYQGQALASTLTALNEGTAQVMDMLATWQNLPAAMGKYGLERFVSSVKISDIWFNPDLYVHYEDDYLYDERHPDFDRDNLANLADSYDLQAVRGDYGDIRQSLFAPLLLADTPNRETGQPLLLIADFKPWVAAKFLMARGWRKIPAIVYDGLSPYDVVNYGLHYKMRTGGVHYYEIYRCATFAQTLPGNPDSPKRASEVDVIKQLGMDRSLKAKLDPVFADPTSSDLVRDHLIASRVAVKVYEVFKDPGTRHEVLEQISSRRMRTRDAEALIEQLQLQAPEERRALPSPETSAPTYPSSAASSPVPSVAPVTTPTLQSKGKPLLGTASPSLTPESDEQVVRDVRRHVTNAYAAAKKRQDALEEYMGDNAESFLDSLFRLKKYLDGLEL